MIGNSWDTVLFDIFNDKNFIKFYNEILKLYECKNIYPSKENIFRAFKLTSHENLKVIIIGQDPYPGKNIADGLAFSSMDKKVPASLKNIFKELNSDLGINNNTADLTNGQKKVCFL